MRKILFIIDRIELKYFEFNDLVTNFWLIKEFLKHNHDVFIATIDDLAIKNAKAFAFASKTFVENENIKYQKQNQEILIEEFDMVFFRPDPPVDIDYINATYIFDFVDESKTVFINHPKAIRNFNEKLHITYFPDFVPENIVTANINEIKNFVEVHSKAVIKPLNMCFGSGVFCLDKDDINLNTLIKSSTNNGSKIVMVQKYLENAKLGDKRVLLLGDDVLEQCVIKAPLKNDFKFSQHSDEYLKKAVLTDKERELCKIVARKLNSIGLPMAGLDLIDEKIIEINITSPCYFIKEINNLFGVNLEKKLLDYFESKFSKKQVAK